MSPPAVSIAISAGLISVSANAALLIQATGSLRVAPPTVEYLKLRKRATVLAPPGLECSDGGRDRRRDVLGDRRHWGRHDPDQDGRADVAAGRRAICHEEGADQGKNQRHS